MSRRRVKTPGWATFDPKKQQKQVADDETQNDPYPPISTNITKLPLSQTQNRSRNVDLTAKSFSSVLSHSTSVPDNAHGLTENSQSEKLTSKYIQNNVSQFYEKLKEIHPWANENLIEDIMTAVDNDIYKASNLLTEMAPRGTVHDKKETKFENEVCVDERLDDNVQLGLDDNVQLGFMIDGLNMVPMEPEWEDDDMYIMQRKEAIRAMRLASRHSKSATEAYLRQDHAAAHEYSQKAQEEWSNAEKLNAKAALEILAVRNRENDDWKLDLHGLHATEAVKVLIEHLVRIESPVLGTRSAKFDKINVNVNVDVRSTAAASLEFVGLETEKSDRQQQMSRPRLLEVITGKGNHSRGEAALPVAIKSFLSENGYYYYEGRSGVITVQPKFRQLSTALSNAL